LDDKSNTQSYDEKIQELAELFRGADQSLKVPKVNEATKNMFR